MRRFLLGGEWLGEGSSRDDERGEDGPLLLCEWRWRWEGEERCFLRTGLMMGGDILCFVLCLEGMVDGRLLLLFRFQM